jgi:hypothetical protein
MFTDVILKVTERTNDGDPARLRSERLDMARAAITTKFQRTQSRDTGNGPSGQSFEWRLVLNKR